jgi:hypothetical protein
MSSEELATVDPTEAEVRAVVGPRADFYLRKWAATERGGFNWAAFFLSGLWLPYRKMYRATIILYGLVLLESIAEELVFVGWLGWQETPRAVERGVTVAVCWTCGALGNRWYRSYVTRAVATARLREPDEPQRLKLLASKGGTSILRSLVWFVAFLVAIVSAMIALELALGSGGGAG